MTILSRGRESGGDSWKQYVRWSACTSELRWMDYSICAEWCSQFLGRRPISPGRQFLYVISPSVMRKPNTASAIRVVIWDEIRNGSWQCMYSERIIPTCGISWLGVRKILEALCEKIGDREIEQDLLNGAVS